MKKEIVSAQCVFCKTFQAQSYECINCKAAGMYLHKVGA